MKLMLNIEGLTRLREVLFAAARANIHERDTREMFDKWRYTCGRNHKKVVAALNDRIREAADMASSDKQLNIEYDDYLREHGKMVDQFVDPSFVRKSPDELKEGETEQVRIDPARREEFETAQDELKARFATCLQRAKELQDRVAAFQAQPVEIDLIEFRYGTAGVPVDVNGTYMAELEWMIQEPEGVQVEG